MLTGPVLTDTAAMIKNSRQGDLRELMSELNKGEEKASEDGSESETDLLARSLESPTLQHTQSVNSIQFNQPTNQAWCRRKEGRKLWRRYTVAGLSVSLWVQGFAKRVAGWLAQLSHHSHHSHHSLPAPPSSTYSAPRRQAMQGQERLAATATATATATGRHLLARGLPS